LRSRVPFATNREGSRIPGVATIEGRTIMWPGTERRAVSIARPVSVSRRVSIARPVSIAGPLKYQQHMALPLLVFLLAFAAIMVTQGQSVPSDPGVRPGGPDAGGPIPGLSAGEQNFFARGTDRFNEIESVSGTIEPGSGLGPRFNS